MILGIALAGAGGITLWQAWRPKPLAAGFASSNGRIEAIACDVSAKLAGRLKQVLGDEGDFVVRGCQIAALCGTTVLTILPATSFCGLLDPVSSLQGPGAVIGAIYPTAHDLTISTGTFSKQLGFADLLDPFAALLLAVPLLLGLSVLFLRKQET